MGMGYKGPYSLSHQIWKRYSSMIEKNAEGFKASWEESEMRAGSHQNYHILSYIILSDVILCFLVLCYVNLGAVIRHCDCEQEKEVDSCGLFRYAHYRHLLLEEGWQVPELIGRWPRTPSADATLEEKVKFALFAMLLFRPWRWEEDCPDILWRSSSTLRLGLSAGATPETKQAALQKAQQEIWDEFVRWEQEDVDTRADPAHLIPQDLGNKLDSEVWWAALTKPRLRMLCHLRETW